MKKIYVGIDESGITTRHRKNKKEIDEYNKITNQISFTVTAVVFLEWNFLIFNDLYNKQIKELFYDKTIHFLKYKNSNKILKWLDFLKFHDFKIYHCFIDLNSFYQRYRSHSYDPYNLSIFYLLERIIKDYFDYEIIIYIESRNWDFDMKTYSYIYSMIKKNN